MNKYLELPLVEPIYSTYHNAVGSAIIKDNMSIRNYYLNQVMVLSCTRKFLNGFTTPEVLIRQHGLFENPHLERIYYPQRFLDGCLDKLITNLLDAGYYVFFTEVDDYYVEGKSWYKQRHFNHDGLICGYNRDDKTYCMYAYDSKWLYRKFWTPRKGFEEGRKSALQQKAYGTIYGLKPKPDIVEFSPTTIYVKLKEYLDSDMEKYPLDGEGTVYGIVVHEYMAEYVFKLLDGSVPYERMDRRIFRLLWEHKKAMQERIIKLEESLNLNHKFSEPYKKIVSDADKMRMLYASHNMRRRDFVLPTICDMLVLLSQNEKQILTDLVYSMEKEFEKNVVEIPKS